ncbi:murein biosynthesis integral membrane protein MurJ [Candidatus Curtissbacteria bacterium]|nr:murein biosynthesis integral membrane protein MurJ [Candidatus Curtissbacteria bacterium]
MINLLKNGANFLKKRQEDILSAAFVIAVSVALSRALGLIRYRLLASYFGHDLKLLDSFIAASVLPDAIFEVLIFGAIGLAFIPVFSKYLHGDEMQRAWKFASTMISIGLVVFLVFAILIFVLAPYLPQFIAPGVIAKDPLTSPLIARLLRIMIFAQAFFVVSIFVTGILQSFQRFIVPALASIFYNAGIILSIIFLAPVFGIYAPALGMILGALLHLLIQLPLVGSLGLRFKFNFNIKDQDVRETFALMWPRMLGLGIIRIADLINVALASIAAVGSIVAFNFAQVLQLVPISLFAGSIAQAALPSLSLRIHAQKMDQFRTLFRESFHQILFLILPFAAILAILRIPVVRLVFGAREFPWETTVLTGRVLIAFSIGIAAQASGLLLLRGFHAIKDSMTPVKINIVSVFINVTLSVLFILVLNLSLIYLALSYSVGSIVNALLMLYILDKRVHFEKKEFILPIIKMGAISIVTAFSLYIPMKFLDQLVFDTTKTVGLIFLTSVATSVGLFVYFSLSWIFKVEQVYIFAAFIKRVIKWPRKIFESASASVDAQQKI